MFNFVRSLRYISVSLPQHAEAKLFNEEGEPTPEHLELILWAYSPEAARLKKCLPEAETEVSRKRRSSAQEESPAKKKKD